ncbi:hypothetical protein M0G43_10950 [Subsaxibacter sp. CAU 1640]|uniref:hypothetical protein n=1 Tax=Subsaxibacter sp. CAU 1640 TaxID=2933271 RepID=UPI002005CE35|nr:hypothetical protein [Subsaxibacter sp. CAU 1640]MCK7591093.1 hypothetical protein [Subsaxibacter sp. CAU 1640]
MKLNLNGKNTLHKFLVIPIISYALIFISCNETPKTKENKESELIMKINAVQEQVMAQGNVTTEEEQALLSLCSIVSQKDGLANYSPENRMVLKDVERAPIYEGCEDLSAEQTQECFSHKVSTFIHKEFNLDVAKELNLSEPKQVDAFFIINENGNVTGLKVRDADVSIQAEILRVLRKIPAMKPAMHNGKNVAVLCSIIVTYGNDIKIENVYIPELPTD